MASLKIPSNSPLQKGRTIDHFFKIGYHYNEMIKFDKV